MTIDEFIAEWHNDLPYIVARTSGSTGAPKTIRLDKGLVEESARRTIDYFGLGKGARLHLCLSPDYIAGKMMIVRSLLADATLTSEAPSNQLTLAHDASPVDLLAVVPSQLAGLLDKPEVFDRIRAIIVGGSPLSPELVEKCSQLPTRIVETYGMTETASHIALRQVGEEYFTPLSGVMVTADDRGALVIDLGKHGTLTTNDAAEILPDGRFKILGRLDDAIITGALKVHPAELERRIAGSVAQYFPGRQYAVIGIPDSKWGQAVTLCIEDKERRQAAKDLLDNLQSYLAPHELPRSVRFFEKFPLTESGKIRRSAIVEG